MSSLLSKKPSSTFLASAAVLSVCLWLIRRRRRNHSSDLIGSPSTTEDATIGSRGLAALPLPMSYLSDFFQCLQDPYDPQYNRQGYIGLCVAENKLAIDLLAERLESSPGTGFSNPQVYCYGSFLGLPVTREAIAYFLAKRFLFPDDPTLTREIALQHIQPTHVAVGAGAASLLSHLFYILGEEGDCCLIPAPYYASFESDVRTVARIQPYPVSLANPANKGPTPQELDLAFIEARSKGLNVRFLLLTNPNNPLGVIYSPETMSDIIGWARKRKLHIIVDELYALSEHQRHNHVFESAIRILENNLGNDVHHVWALSKDFGASGFRVGTLYSQNEQLLQALANLNIFSGVSHPIQMMTAEILTDDAFVDTYLDCSRERLLHSYTICALKLEEMVVPFVHAQAGQFVYVDFSSLLPIKSFEGEAMLHDIIVRFARIVLSPGQSQRDSRPGMFRICYAWVSPDALIVGMERLSRLVVKIRKMDWSDLNETSLESVLNV